MPTARKEKYHSQLIDNINLFLGKSVREETVTVKYAEAIRECLGKKVKMLSMFWSSLVGGSLCSIAKEDNRQKTSHFFLLLQSPFPQNFFQHCREVILIHSAMIVKGIS